MSPSALPSVTLPLANASATSLAFFVFFGDGDGGAFDDLDVDAGFDDDGAGFAVAVGADFDVDDAGFDGGDVGGVRAGTVGVPFDSRAGDDGGVDVGARFIGPVRSFAGGLPMPRRGVFIVGAPSEGASSSPA